MQPIRWQFVDKVMIVAIALFAGVILLDALILVSSRLYFPGTAGGGDALLMIFLPLLSYVVACILLVPSLIYLLHRKLTCATPVTAMQTLLVWISIFIVITPPAVIYLLPFFR